VPPPKHHTQFQIGKACSTLSIRRKLGTGHWAHRDNTAIRDIGEEKRREEKKTYTVDEGDDVDENEDRDERKRSTVRIFNPHSTSEATNCQPPTAAPNQLQRRKF
jgi:hypothetical protein